MSSGKNWLSEQSLRKTPGSPYMSAALHSGPAEECGPGGIEEQQSTPNNVSSTPAAAPCSRVTAPGRTGRQIKEACDIIEHTLIPNHPGANPGGWVSSEAHMIPLLHQHLSVGANITRRYEPCTETNDYRCVCVCVSACAYTLARAPVCVCVCVGVCVCVCTKVCGTWTCADSDVYVFQGVR